MTFGINDVKFYGCFVMYFLKFDRPQLHHYINCFPKPLIFFPYQLIMHVIPTLASTNRQKPLKIIIKILTSISVLSLKLLALPGLVFHVGFCWHGTNKQYQPRDWGTERPGSSTAVRWDCWLLYSYSGEELSSRVNRGSVQWRASSSSIRVGLEVELFIAGELLPWNVERLKHLTTDYFTRFDSVL